MFLEYCDKLRFYVTPLQYDIDIEMIKAHFWVCYIRKYTTIYAGNQLLSANYKAVQYFA